MPNLLKVKDLKISFYLGNQEIKALDGVNLNIGKSETVVLAGESGSGKTVSCLALTKILPKNARIISGSAEFSGVDLLKLDELALVKMRGKEIAYIFQEPSSFLNPIFTLGNQITETIILHQDKSLIAARKTAINLLSLVQIQEPERVFNSYPHQLSGGLNQRAFIAMALACQPKLLIADEPTTSLDVTIEAQILKLLVSLKESLGFSLLFITHNLSIAQRIAERIYVMYQGRVVEEGEREKIFNAPEHFHTKELIKAFERIGKI